MVNKWTDLGFKGTDLVDGSKVKGQSLGMQVLYKALTYRFDQDPLDHFADLCQLANISTFVLDEVAVCEREFLREI